MRDRIAKPVIAVVDDDSRIRESLTSLIESAGFTVWVFSLANDLLKGDSLARTSCLITDFRMPGMDGLGCSATFSSSARNCLSSSSQLITMMRSNDVPSHKAPLLLFVNHLMPRNCFERSRQL
jgi:FixJ family two-component response regulator